MTHLRVVSSEEVVRHDVRNVGVNVIDMRSRGQPIGEDALNRMTVEETGVCFMVPPRVQDFT